MDMLGFTVPNTNTMIDALSNVKAKVNECAGYCTQENWENLPDTSKFYLMQSSGTALMAVDGLLAGDVGTFVTGVGNTGKNIAFFPIKKALKKKFKEPDATLIADTASSVMSIGTNVPQLATNFNALVDVVESGVTGDVVRGVSGLLAVSAYGVQAGYNAYKLLDHKVSGSDTEKTFPFDKIKALKSKFSGYISEDTQKSLEHATELTGKFLTQVGEKFPGQGLGARAVLTTAGGVVTANPLMVSYGALLMGGAFYRYRSGQDPSAETALDNSTEGTASGQITDQPNMDGLIIQPT